MVVLISSLLLYNTYSNIDEQGISEISLAAHISNSIAIDSQTESKEKDQDIKDSIITELAPKFIWLIRDFALEKIHPDTNEPISSKEYLELCLNKKISGKNSNENNLIRENLIKYFHERDCITLTRPVDTEEDLQNMKKMPFSKLNHEFKSEIMTLKNEIYKNTQSKKFQGKKLTGESLYRLIHTFIRTLNEGKIPNISNAWEQVILNDINENYEKAKIILRDNEKELNDKIRKEELASQGRNDITFNKILSSLFSARKEALVSLMQFKLANRDTFSYNKRYLEVYNEKKKTIEEESSNIHKRIISNYNSFAEKVNDSLLRDSSKDIEKAISTRKFNEKNYLDYIDLEDKFLSKIENNLVGSNIPQIFSNFYLNLITRVFESIEANIK